MRFARVLCAAVCLSVTGSAQQAATPADIAAGKRLFESQCALCHGIGGSGGRGPALTAAKLHRADTSAELVELILSGVESNGMPSFWYLGEKPVTQLAAYVRSLGAQPLETALPGNAEHGKQVYSRNGCAGCHMAAGEGSAFGPELTAIGAQRSAAYLRESLLNPDAAFPEGFVTVQAVLRDGTKLDGVRLNEDTFTIQIREANGRFHSLRKTELTGLRKEFATSPMPSYRGKLSDSDLDDLVAWLASLKGKP